MPLDPAAFLALASQCAPGVAPETLLAVARVESGLDPLAVGQNGRRSPLPRLRTAAEAAAHAEALLAQGRDLDLGLAQINVRNLGRLGLSVREAFDPCRNLAAAGEVLADGYRRGAARTGPGQAALRVALSYYNTGHPRRGFANGYVARVLGRAGLPAARLGAAPAPPAAPPAWDVFGRARRSAPAFVLTPAGGPP